MRDFDLATYLQRIGLDPVPATAEGLRALQRAQLRTIPFENLDPYLGATPVIEPAAIFDKIVIRRRGGYCFELNTLLGAAMAGLGFTARRSMARVRRGGVSGARSHLLWRVDIDGEAWLADTGFGGPGALEPLRIDTDAVQSAPNGRYRLRSDPISAERVLERETADGWIALYGFDTAHVGDMDVVGANFLCANWRMTPFPDHLMLAGFDGSTRIGVFDRGVTVESADGDKRSVIHSRAELAALFARLRLPLADDMIGQVWARLSAVPA